ncbi:DMT family transporter [Egicoccus halophilus]|uniref:Membrane protein n=1 Tax=Egicoccus halophilus TaxID=1670830 RepID=A0A8J3AAX9_9ACTN|nr:DMT family transporter [Egicoccus halophilus]GGI09601.1 membrane protein [Egicoccus halophilus]
MHAPARGSATFTPADTALLLTLGSMWGLSFLFIELGLRGLGPVSIVAGRTFIGATVLLVAVAFRRQRTPRSWRWWGHVAVLGVLSNAVPWTAVAAAQRAIPSGLAALLMALVPSSTFLVAASLRMERVTAARIAGLAMALAGVGIIVAPDLGDRGRVLAVVTVVAATVLYAGGAVYAKRYVSGTAAPLMIATGQVLTAFLAALPMALVIEGVPTRAALRADVLGAVAALGVFGTGLAYLVFYLLIARVGATNTTLTTYLIPLVAVVAGALFLGERLGAPALAGGVAIVLGIWLAQRRAPGPVEQLERLKT